MTSEPEYCEDTITVPLSWAVVRATDNNARKTLSAKLASLADTRYTLAVAVVAGFDAGVIGKLLKVTVILLLSL